MNIQDIYSLFIKSNGVSTDTRNIKEGQLFFALKGGNFNGNKYAQQAIDNGASYAIIDEEVYKSSEKCILVDDVLKALQELAHYHRNQFDIPVLGITGSNGKTTTKELIHAALSTQYNVHYTKGNFNNHIGVPLTLLEMPSDTEIAIIEMGANHMKEIELLSSIADPTHGIINNCGLAHIEGFGSADNIKKGKGELYDHIRSKNGTLFVNSQLDYLMEMSEGVDRVLYENIQLNTTQPCLNLEVDGLAFDVRLIGSYNIPNISAAYCIGRHFNIDSQKIIEGLSAYQPEGLNRSELKTFKEANIIMDAYNANPTSMDAALDSFNSEDYSSKLVILGDMFELGDTSDKEHQKILIKLSELPFDGKVVVGEIFDRNNCDEEIISFENTEALKEWFDQQDIAGSSILIKGSRGMKLESLITV
jgi:UDP-N-acetylmuramoyl-tripeptide--D-alanyl-D-alanine ligase